MPSGQKSPETVVSDIPQPERLKDWELSMLNLNLSYADDLNETEDDHTVDLNDLIRQVILQVQAQITRRPDEISPTLPIDTALHHIPRIIGHTDELRQMVMHLISNAMDAIVDGGDILVCTHLEDEAVVLEVTDSGSGMTEEVQRRCMDPLFSTKNKDGVGLGLALVVRTVYRHRGTIHIDSTPDEGTTFLIRLRGLKQVPMQNYGLDVPVMLPPES